jgi:putative hemolysin
MELLIIFFLILLNGVFSMSEIALVSARKFKLESAARKGKSNAKKALDLSNNPNTFLSTVQIGITLIGILTGIYSGDKITEDVKAGVARVEFMAPYADSISVALVLIVLTFFSIVLGELIPKRIGLMFPEKIAMTMATPMTFLSIVAKPFIWLLTATNNLILGLFGLKNSKEGIISEEEIKAMVQESAEGGVIEEIEQDIVHRVFALGDRKVSELMTHRSDLVFFDITDSFELIKTKVSAEPHSVYPVVDRSFDHPLGIVSVKNLFSQDLQQDDFDLRKYLRQPIVVHGARPAYKLLEDFKKEKTHYAFVIDEYGVVEGMISLDDILDALIGNVTEDPESAYRIIKREDGSWLADGQFPFFEFLEFFDLPRDTPSGDYNTIAGLFMSELDHMPVVGEKIVWNGMKMEVVDMDGRRIDKMLIEVERG